MDSTVKTLFFGPVDLWRHDHECTDPKFVGGDITVTTSIFGPRDELDLWSDHHECTHGDF